MCDSEAIVRIEKSSDPGVRILNGTSLATLFTPGLRFFLFRFFFGVVSDPFISPLAIVRGSMGSELSFCPSLGRGLEGLRLEGVSRDRVDFQYGGGPCFLVSGIPKVYR